MRFLAALGIMIFSISAAVAGGNKPKMTLRIHFEISSVLPKDKTLDVQLEAPPIMVRVSRSPELSERDVVKAELYEQVPGSVMLTLSDFGKRRLNALTMTSRGLRMIVLVNGRVVYSPAVDATLPNGKLLIPSGLTSQELEFLKRYVKKNKGR